MRKKSPTTYEHGCGIVYLYDSTFELQMIWNDMQLGECVELFAQF